MALPHDDQELLSRILHFYRGELLENPKTHEELEQLGLAEAPLLESLAVGINVGGLTRMIPENPATLAAAKALRFLNPEGRDQFTHHLILPLRSPNGHLVGYGAVDLGTRLDTAVLFEPFGCLYPSEIRQAKRVCLATSPLVALQLARLGEKAVLVAAGHDLLRHLSHLSEFSFQEAVLAFDDAELVKSAARGLEIQGIEPLCFMLAQGEKLHEILKTLPSDTGLEELLEQVTAVPVGFDTAKTAHSENTLHFDWPDRSYRVRLIDPERFDHLKVSVKLTKNSRWHLDTIDLGLAKQRQAFLQMAKKVVRMEPALLYHDLLFITEEVERYQANRILRADKEAPHSQEIQSAAEEFLKDPHLFEQLAEDLIALGWFGDPRCALIGYLMLASRKLDRPLALAWLEQEGYPNLADLLLPLLPEEDLVYLTRPSPKALLYQDEEALAHRVIVAETHTLSSEALSCLSKLVKGQELHAQVVVRDPQSGRLKTATHRVKGSCALFLTFSGQGKGTQNRWMSAPVLPLGATEEISMEDRLASAAREDGLGHMTLHLKRERLMEKHRAVQRMLKTYAVVNPHADAICQKEKDIVRYQRLSGLARAIAYLRQQQKQVHSEGERPYVEVSEADLALAATLSKALADGGWPTPYLPSQKILKAILQRLECAGQTSFTRSQVREWTGLSETTVRDYLDQLEIEGSLERLDRSVGRGRTYRYRLSAAAHLRAHDKPRTSNQREVGQSQPKAEFEVAESSDGFAPFAPHRNGHG